MMRPRSFPRGLLFGATLLPALLTASCDAGSAPSDTGPDGIADAGPVPSVDVVADAAAPAPPDDEGEVRVPDEAFVAWLTGVRAEVGLAPVAASPTLQDAAAAHADFLVRHGDAYASRGLSAHTEPEDLEGFTGATFMERLAHFGYGGEALAEVIAFKPSALAAGRSWLESVYHRLPLLDPEARDVGYGEAGADGRWSNVLEIGRPAGDTPEARLIAWPPDGAADVPTSWDGAEIPQPPAPPGGYPSGPVVTLQTSGGALDVGVAVVTSTVDEVPAPLRVLTSDDDPAMPRHAVAILPHEPLAPETTYRVTLAGTLDQVPFDESWTFTTRREGCDVLLQDCGSGRGCYFLGDGPTCLWAGSSAAGETCSHVNECGAGLTCLGSRCRPVCNGQAQGGPNSCAEQCEHGFAPLGEQGPEAACLPPSCALDPGTCGPSEGCYWVGSFVCDQAGEAGDGESCTYANDCAPGLGCLGLDGDYACRALCDGPGLPDCEHSCEEGHQPLDPESGVRFCL
ncbi:MAG: CAP domain-containing protein [Myxococcota bacterium]